MSSVTVGGPGLVAVRSDVGRAAVWISIDGITWSRVPHDEAFLADGLIGLLWSRGASPPAAPA